MVGLSCYILIDTLFISLALGAPGLAALNLSISVFSIISGVGQMIGIGGGTDFSLRLGEGKDANAAFRAALVCSAAASAVFFLIGLFFSRPLSLLLGADQITLDMTNTYVKITLLFAPCHILNATLQAFVRNDGAPKLAMASMLTSSAANIVLDYLFMFPFQMGMFGAVLATGLSALLSILVLSVFLFSPRCSLRLSRNHASLHEMLRLLSYGLSALIGELASAFSLLAFNLILMRIGGYVSVAAYGIIANAALVASAIFTGVGQGMQPLASKAYGCRDQAALARLKRYTQHAVLYMGILLFAFVYAFASPIASVFNHESNPQLQTIAQTGLRLYFSGYLFAGFNIVASAYLSAMSRAVHALVISLLRSCMLLIPVVWIMSCLLLISGVWLSFPVTEAIVCLFAVLFFRHADHL